MRFVSKMHGFISHLFVQRFKRINRVVALERKHANVHNAHECGKHQARQEQHHH